MADEPRITDHEPIIAAARADASVEGGRLVTMTLRELWGLLRRGPRLAEGEGQLGGVLRAE